MYHFASHHHGRVREGAARAPRGARGQARRALLAGAAALVVTSGFATAPTASAAGVDNAVFSGGAGTVTVGGSLYARQGAALTLTVTTSNDTKCVSVSGAFADRKTSESPASSWVFSTTAPSGNGQQAVTVAASPGYNKQGDCTGATKSLPSTYTLDNSGPVVTPALSPAPNHAGWNNSDVTVTWTASDTGAGVSSGPTPTSSTENANGIVTRTSTAADRLGNVGNGSVTVRVDKAAPSITATQQSSGFGQPTTVTFRCDDSDSGGQQSSGIASCVADGTNPASNSVTVSGNATVTGTATDRAGNTKKLSVEVRNVDDTPPLLSGAATTGPNANGWYTGDVGVRWTASDPESGIPTPPADTTITGEGTGLTSTQTVRNGAGLQATASSAPAVKIDRTAPTTAISGASNDWVDGAVTIHLSSTDNLSDVATTSYSLDGGPLRHGTSLTVSTEGQHTLSYFSTDKAGNAETAKSTSIRIDKTAPTVAHKFDPAAYLDGAWTNGDVTVSFDCADQGGSGLAGCSAPVTVSTEGGGQQVRGTARDHAGNTTSDMATVSIDKTKPTIAGAGDRAANGTGWYDRDVTVAFACEDDRSGISACTPPATLGEGENQSVTGHALDAAGNRSETTVGDIDVDKTDPTLDGSAPAGWSTGDVTITWTASDILSGVAGTTPEPSTVTGEGDNLSATASVADRAGNITTRIVRGVRIDRTPPTTTATVPVARDSGWYDQGVEVTLTGHDGLSGVAATYYRIDHGAPQPYDGSLSVTDEGVHTVSYWSRDAAGNVERAGAPLTLRVDRTPPVTTATNPISPDSGWFVTSGVPFAFAADDSVSGSAHTYFTVDGGRPQEYGQPFTADLSNGTHRVTYWSVDLAGNEEQVRSFDVNVDTVAPSIEGSRTPDANRFGWNNTSVSVDFSCTDMGSGMQTGVAGCAGDSTLENEGAGQSVMGDAVDVAGNRSTATVGDINIDKTEPTLTGAPTTDPVGNGWYTDDVMIRWTGDDELSGLDPATLPADSRITGEGSNLGTGPVTVADRAGNLSAPASVTGIRIDRTAPVVVGSPSSRTAAVNGWYRDAVTVDFTCTDNLSGVALCPTSKVLRGDGSGQSVTSGPAHDEAGNTTAGTTVGGISIDGTAPTTTADNQCTRSNGWCTGATANVVLAAADQAGLSGVQELRYRVNGGDQQVKPGATATIAVPLDGDGEARVTYFAVDNAGNVEQANTVTLLYDNIAPTVTHTVSPQANAEGWHRRDLVVRFDAKDNDAGSGVASGSVTPDTTVDTETSGRVITGTARDQAGNVGTDTVTVKLDKTAPGISGAVMAGESGSNGWYVGPVTVHFRCSDALSGVATCPEAVQLTRNGASSAEGTATDWAGNARSASVAGIMIDQEKPSVSEVNVSGKTFTLGSVPAATCTATDDVSGLQSCGVEVNGGTANGVGTFTYVATAVDRAGNRSTATGSYTVRYRWGGFLQPINDTAHQVSTSTSVFKAGSTVPVKFQLRNAAGQVVRAGTAPVWLTPARGSATSAPVDEKAYAETADSGSTYRYDATGDQYHYNWKTGAGGSYWRIGVKLDDGQTYYVNIGLR